MSNQALKMVAYADGSARPFPGQHGAGFAGSGIHGYFFHYPEGKEKGTKINNWVATDKGYLFQQDIEVKQAKPVVVDQYFFCHEPIPAPATNNIGELNAIALLEKIIERVGETDYVFVISDSDNTIKGITSWMYSWANSNWIKSDQKPVKNQALWEKVYAFITQFKQNGHFEGEWVLGHNDNLGNCQADYLASVASGLSVKGKTGEIFFKTYPADSFYKPDEKLHPFLCLKRIYFNSMPEFNPANVYYQTGWVGQDFIMGKRSGETTFSVVHLETPCEYLDVIKDRASQCFSQYNVVLYAKIDRLKNKSITRFVEDFGGEAFLNDPRNRNLNFLDRIPVVHEVRSGELPLRGFDTLAHLSELLSNFKGSFKEGKPAGLNETNHEVFDITDVLYDSKVKQVKGAEVAYKELKKEYGVGFTDLKLTRTGFDGKQLDFKILLGEDIPSRNSLKKIEVLNPVVFIVCWRESSQFVRYATVIMTDDAAGIWSNYFANQIVLKT